MPIAKRDKRRWNPLKAPRIGVAAFKLNILLDEG
jgi:hypothetical protein